MTITKIPNDIFTPGIPCILINYTVLRTELFSNTGYIYHVLNLRKWLVGLSCVNQKRTMYREYEN